MNHSDYFVNHLSDSLKIQTIIENIIQNNWLTMTFTLHYSNIFFKLNILKNGIARNKLLRSILIDIYDLITSHGFSQAFIVLWYFLLYFRKPV